MTWITLGLDHASAPHSRADAERPERRYHAECSSLYTSRNAHLERALFRPWERTGRRSVCPRKLVHPTKIQRLKRSIRGQVRFTSDTAFLQVDLCITMSAERGNDHHRVHPRGRMYNDECLARGRTRPHFMVCSGLAGMSPVRPPVKVRLQTLPV